MSDQFTVDLSNYKDKVGSRVDPGRYRVLIEDAEMDKSAAGNQMINLWFRIMDGEWEGQTIVDRLVLTEKSLFRVVGCMQALGLPTPKKRLQLNLRQFIGKVIDIDVDDGDPYNGRVKSEVRGYARPKGAGVQDDAPDLEDVDTTGAEDLGDVPADVDLETLNL
jgi:hypothetical protein